MSDPVFNLTITDITNVWKSANITKGDNQTTLAFVVQNAWAVALIGMMVVLLGFLICTGLTLCQCFCDKTGFCRDKCGCCRCCACCKSADAPTKTKPSATDGKAEVPTGQFMTA